MSNGHKKEFDWFDRPENKKKLWILLWATCIISVLTELFVDRHGHFSFDGFFGFYAVLGFIACAASILLAKALGVMLKANEDYYDHDAE